MRHLILLAVILLLSCASIQAHAQAVSIANDGATGTVIGQLAKFVVSGSSNTAIRTSTGDSTTTTAMGIVIGWTNGATSGTTGNALIATGGMVLCTFDASGVTVGHIVVNSSTINGDCKDGGTTLVHPGMVGIAQQTVASGSALVLAYPPGS